MKVKLHIDDAVKPVIQPHRPLPDTKNVSKEIQLFKDQGIIEKVEGPTPWVSPIVAQSPKNSEKIRICDDMLPTVDEISMKQ